MSTAPPSAGSPLKQALTALREGQESYGQLVLDLFTDLETMQQRLFQAESQVILQKRQLAEFRSPLSEEYEDLIQGTAPLNAEVQEKVAELENERQALEHELENLRTQADDMAQTLAEQKQHMVEEHAQWVGELRQLRGILDKQSKWITQNAEPGSWSGDEAGHYGSFYTEQSHSSGAHSHGDGHATHTIANHLHPDGHAARSHGRTPAGAAHPHPGETRSRGSSAKER